MIQSKHTGFSLVELVVVIVIVGLLAVAALPRFLDVTDRAKKASVEGVAGGYATGVLSARAQWEAESRPSVTVNTETYNSVNYDGVEFWLTRAKNSSNVDTGYRDGYPWAIRTDDNYPTTLTNQICVELMENLLQNSPDVERVDNIASSNNVKYSAQADNNERCTYIQNVGGVDNQFVYEIKTGRVVVTIQ
ncbi:MSHA pilin protein MshB [Vibrio zhanjiangensis]|uniref:MSHA pilin protein MshB n=1 Tax=Vibrio zhanjiangensis TaxID=1046128 RepID=A0ABQ6EVT2_9VIBR|nr:prepilin-type N-terminal cleavage/methylation domain-containing protein [Vibrio zhanjiangensis]GLT17114.1 MSHA pilin protein MshB [Vibrio zhanjiangensis]